jgi:hypothetical protein
MRTGHPKGINFIYLFFFIISVVARAQETSPLLFLPGVPQASFENPAYQNQTGRFVIGIPVLSGFNVNWNSNVSFNSLFTDGFVYSFNRLYDSLDENGNIQSGVKVIIFYASVRHNKTTFNLSVSERAITSGKINRGVIEMLRDGIIGYYASEEILGPSRFRFLHYKELSFGFASEISKGLHLGFRPKVLFGKYYLNTRDFIISLDTDFDNRELLINPEGRYILSGPLLYNDGFKSNIFPGDYFFQLRNLGFALDAGMVVRPNKNLEWSIALTDAGLIGFGHNNYDLEVSRSIKYSEDRLFQSNLPNSERYLEPWEALKAISDSISTLLLVEHAPKTTYSILPFKFSVTGKYYLSEKLSLGLSNQFNFYKYTPVNFLSVFAHGYIIQKFELAGSISLYNNTEIMPGVGASYSFRRSQFYLASNNILGIIQPASSKHLNLSLGINFLFDTR